MRLRILVVISISLISAFVMAQPSVREPQFVNPDDARVVSVPGAPECATFAVEHGNPKADSSVMQLLKLTRGCTVPMHWHSGNEQLMLISGTAQVEMQGEQSHTLKAGSYVFMPAHHFHQLSCPTDCTFHRAVDVPIDIHYVDSAGNEIPAEKALAAFGEHPAAPMAPK
jgi:quercetin dioxygenase-like cupin family protein